MMQLGVEGVFVGSSIFKLAKNDGTPDFDKQLRLATAIVEATTHYNNPDVIAKVSEGLGALMSGIAVRSLKPEEILADRGW